MQSFGHCPPYNLPEHYASDRVTTGQAAFPFVQHLGQWMLCKHHRRADLCPHHCGQTLSVKSQNVCLGTLVEYTL